MGVKRDIENEKDIELLVHTFYEKVGQDELIGYLFNDVAKVHWESHLPKMVRFWSSVLLGAAEYKGNPMQKHVELSQQSPFHIDHFERWLKLWRETIDQIFVGFKAEDAKVRAQSIAEIMKFKVNTIQKQ